MDLIHKDGYSISEYRACNFKLSLDWVIDASKDDARWVVRAESRYEAAVELTIMLGWDLEC